MAQKYFHFMKTQYALEALRRSRLKVALIHKLNDPFDLLGAVSVEAAHNEKFRSFKEENVAKNYGILCFSKSMEDPVMWSHYTDCHRGIALEFEISDEDIIEVNYVKERVNFDNRVNQAIQRNTFTEDDVLGLLRTKFDNWKYENEVRTFHKLSTLEIEINNCTEDLLYFEKYDENNNMKLVGLVLGIECSITKDNIEKFLPKGKVICVKKAKICTDGAYKIVIDECHLVHGTFT
jgi:hypothetical protein